MLSEIDNEIGIKNMPYKNDENHTKLLEKIAAGAYTRELFEIADKCKVQPGPPSIKPTRGMVNCFIQDVRLAKNKRPDYDHTSATELASNCDEFYNSLLLLGVNMHGSKRLGHLLRRPNGKRYVRNALAAAEIGFLTKASQYLFGGYATIKAGELAQIVSVSDKIIKEKKLDLFYKYGRNTAMKCMMEVINRLQNGKGLVC